MTISPSDGVQIVPTGIFGPPPPGIYFFIIGRASVSIAGLIVLPSVVDSDYTGEIKLLATAIHGPVTFYQGQRLAQALPLPLNNSFPAHYVSRGASTPGSSNVYWVQALTKIRPPLSLKIEGQEFLGLLDTGADTSCMSPSTWPESWPLAPTWDIITGAGGGVSPKHVWQSKKILTWEDQDGDIGTFQPYIIKDIPVNLWGRDILEQMQVYLVKCKNKAVLQQMFNQGYIPGKGLGKSNQGIKDPIQPTVNHGRAGLGLPSPFP